MTPMLSDSGFHRNYQQLHVLTYNFCNFKCDHNKLKNYFKFSDLQYAPFDPMINSGQSRLHMSYVSVIIPTYERPELTYRAVKSVLSQTFKDFELLVVDDGSSEESLKLLIDNLKGLKLDLYSKKNAGVSSARNFGASLAKGKWLAFLDSDDEWLPEKLEKQMNFINKNPAFKIVHTEEQWFRKGKKVNIPEKYRKKSGDLFHQATGVCAIGPSTVIIDSDYFHSLKGFDESFPACEDFELWLRIAREQKVGLVAEPLIKKNAGHEGQLSSQPELDYWRVLALRNLLYEYPLNAEQKSAVLTNLTQKLKILIVGYEKYNKSEKLQWAKDTLAEIHFEFDY